MLAEHLCLLQHFSKVAEFRIAGNLLPERNVATFGVRTVVMVVPVRAGSHTSSTGNAQREGKEHEAETGLLDVF